MKKLALFTLLAACLWMGRHNAFAARADAWQTYAPAGGSMVRLHVVAQSDTEQAQIQKLLVRDAVLDVLQEPLRDAENKQDAAACIEDLLPQIRLASCQTLQKAGVSSPHVRVRLAAETFPSIAYDGHIVPAGEYTALRIVIGEGKGRNWWCVLFPPLCYADVHMDETCTPEEADDPSAIQIRWFVQEWLENARTAAR